MASSEKFVPHSLVRVDVVDKPEQENLVGKWLYVKEDHGILIELFVPPDDTETTFIHRFNLYALYHHVKVLLPCYF